MNTSTPSFSLRTLVATAVFSALAASAASVCTAADSSGAPTAIVKYGDLNVSSPQGATMLYQRIRATAEHLCSNFDNKDLAYKPLKDACINGAIAAAVTKVNQDELFVVYNAKNRTTAPTTLVSRNH